MPIVAYGSTPIPIRFPRKTIKIKKIEKDMSSPVQQGYELKPRRDRNLAITPSVAPQMDFAEVTKICYDYTMNGLENMAAVANSPFRFVYTSGLLVERNQTKPLDIWTDYRRMRVRSLSFALIDPNPPPAHRD